MNRPWLYIYHNILIYVYVYVLYPITTPYRCIFLVKSFRIDSMETSKRINLVGFGLHGQVRLLSWSHSTSIPLMLNGQVRLLSWVNVYIHI